MLATSGAPTHARSGNRLHLRALVLAAVVALLLVGGMGFVTAGTEAQTDAPAAEAEATDDDPYTAFATTTPSMGDVVEYTYGGTDGHHEHGAHEAPSIRLQWIETAGVPDADGLGRPTVGLALDRDGDGPEQTYLVDTEARRVYALEGTSQRLETERRDGALGIGTVQEGSQDRKYAVFYGQPFLDVLPCGLLHALQEGPTDLSDGILLFPYGCTLPHGLGVPAGAQFSPVANETLDGHDVVVLAYDPATDTDEQATPDHTHTEHDQDHGHAHDHDHEHEGQASKVRVWMSPHLPYPLRFEVEDPTRPNKVVHTLTGIALGDGTLDEQAQSRDDLRTSPLAERTPWGPDEGAIDHPFPLSEAYENLRLDPQGAAAWSLEHPDAVVTSAWHHTMRDDHGEEHTWSMTLDDGEESVHAWIAKRLQGPPGDTQVPVYRSSVEEPTESLIDPERLPARLPTVEGLLARHAASLPAPAEGVHTWSFDTWCGKDDGCSMQFTAGKKLWDQTGQTLLFPGVLPVEDTRWTLWRSALTTDDAGRAYYLHHTSYEHSWSWSSDGVQDPARKPMQTQSVGLPLPAPTAVVWTPPDTGTVAGAGLIALIFGAAYRVFLHVGAVPLFSRISKAEALDHPLRERIHEAVVATPGIHLRQAARRTGTKVGTVRYHVRKLVECGLLRREHQSGYTCLFPGDERRADVLAAASVTKSPGAQKILAALDHEDAATISSLAETTGLTKQVVSRHVRRMAESGIVEKARAGRTVSVRKA